MNKKFTKIAVAAITVGSLQLVAAVPAHAQARGVLCGFASFTDPTGEGDVQTGEIDGGPLVAADRSTPPNVDATANLVLRCVIQVGAQNATYAGSDAAAAGASGTGAVVLAPTQVSYVSPTGQDVYLCTELTVNGTQYYYDYVGLAWSQSSSVTCALAISQEVDPTPGPVEELELLIDSIICPHLVTVLGGDGDIDGVWNCPPYES